MTIIDIYSGFLGAGKTTLIKKMLQEAYAGQKLMLIENEFGQIGIDGGFLQDAGINITEMNSGCICCSLVGDFGKALKEAQDTYSPDRIIIEPSGVGKLSDVIAAVEKVEGVQLGYTVAVVDAVKVYMRNFGEFYNNQVETASAIILSRTDSIPQDKLDKAVALLREHNDHAIVVTTPWNQLTGQQLLEAMAGGASVAEDLKKLEEEAHHHHHHEEGHHCCGHHHHEEEEHHCCGHHHHEEEEHHCCGHHHHEEEEHHCCGHHDHDHHDHHHHDHHHEDGHCCCGHHDHDHEHHHHHHADEVFASWGVETAKKFEVSQIEGALDALDSGSFGVILRAKGIIPCVQGGWIHFDYVPGEKNVRMGSADVTGKLCVIGAQMDENAVAGLFGV